MNKHEDDALNSLHGATETSATGGVNVTALDRVDLTPEAEAVSPSQHLLIAATDGVTLAGTLQSPHGDGPHAAALLLVGSGEVDRDSDHRKMPLGVTRAIAEALAESGIASLRYDKRGVGASGGDYLTTTFDDARRDAAAALAALRADPAIDPGRVLVIGHSEGAMHATSLAAADPTLAGVALISAPASTGELTMRWQAEQIVPTLPAFARALIRLLRQTPDRTQGKVFAKVRGTDEAVLRIQGRRINAGWLRGFIDFDPAPELARISVPAFALTGAQDLQVDPADLDRMRELIVRAPLEVHRVPAVNHILRHTTGNGSPTEYRKQAKVGQPVDDHVLEALRQWAIHQVTSP